FDSADRVWSSRFALTDVERLRLKVLNEAICASLFGLSLMDFKVVLEECDRPQLDLGGSTAKLLNPKGFWRIDKDKTPELRHTVLSLVAFHDLQEKGLEA